MRLSLVRALESEWPDVRVHACDAVADIIADAGAFADIGVVVFAAGAEFHRHEQTRQSLTALVAALAATPVIVLSDGDTGADARAAVACGARGFVSTQADLPVLMQSIRLVWVGGTVIPTVVLGEQPEASPPPARQAVTRSAEGRVQGEVVAIFTPKEAEVLQCLNLGKPNKIIAYELNICETTVKVHIRHIMRKLGATNRTHAAMLARDLCESIGRD